MRLLFDMNLTPQWVDAVSGSRHHAMHWSKTGKQDAPDDEIFRYAQLHDLMIVTNDWTSLRCWRTAERNSSSQANR